MADQDTDVDFRAPPPSPVWSGRRSFFANDDVVLMDFLEHSLVVPDLILPDRVFPHQVPIQSPPVIDSKALLSSENDLVIDIIRDSISRTGCFQLVNHGIGRGERRAALVASGGVFGLGPEEKKKVTRGSGEREFGFEEVQDHGEGEVSEEFVWGRNEKLRLEMERAWPLGYSNFSEKIEALFLKVEKLADGILLALGKHGVIESQFENGTRSKGKISGPTPSIFYIRKQCSNSDGEDSVNSIKYDVLKMLIRGSDYYSHALGLHVCDGCSEFHVYSKKGWISFVPGEDALVVTIGDRIQAWSNGGYKNVMGRPICRGEDKEFISMAFLYSPTAGHQTSTEKTISLGQQAILAIVFTFVYHFLVYIYKK